MKANHFILSEKNILKHQNLLKAEIGNKKLTNILTQKMFRGYCNIKKWNQIKNNQNKMKKLIKSVEDQNYNPLSENFNLFYKTKIIGSLLPQIDFNPSIEITSAFKERTSLTPKLKKSPLFITYDKQGSSNSTKSDNQSQKCSNQSMGLSQTLRIERPFPKHIYLNETEENVYSRFPFIIINKNQEEDCFCNIPQPQQKTIFDKEKQKESLLAASQSEFLFRISHRKNPLKSQMSFYHNKGLHKGKSINNIFQSESNGVDFSTLKIKNDIKQDLIEKHPNRITILQKGINEVFESIETFEKNLRFNELFEDAKQEINGKPCKVITPKQIHINKPKITTEVKPYNKKGKKSIMPIEQSKRKENNDLEKSHNLNKEILKKQKRFHFSLSKTDGVTKKPEPCIPKIYKKHETIRDNQILNALYQNFNQKDIATILNSTRLMFNSLSQEQFSLKKKTSFK